MKKWLLVLSLMVYPAVPLPAQETLARVLPLLQKPAPTAQETQQIFHVFRTAKDPNVIFAAGASLVKNPPAKPYEPALFNQILSAQDPLKTTFSVIILTSMGAAYEEFIPLLQEALLSQDPVLRAYAAASYGLVNPTDRTYINDVVRLYIFDPAFAQRALNILSVDANSQWKVLAQASQDKDPQVRAAAAAWISNLHTPQALEQLLKRTQKEKEPTVQTQLAIALAANQEQSLPAAIDGLSTGYRKPAATTYALALAFMTGHSVSALKEAILSTNKNRRINALRAVAYMAGLLSNPEGFAYSNDRDFDRHLLKSLVPQITALAKNGSKAEQEFAQNALIQIERLM